MATETTATKAEDVLRVTRHARSLFSELRASRDERNGAQADCVVGVDDVRRQFEAAQKMLADMGAPAATVAWLDKVVADFVQWVNDNHEWKYEAATTGNGKQHAMSRKAAARSCIYTPSASAMCGAKVLPLAAEFDPTSANACGNCRRATQEQTQS